jgi:hypothetical protein
LGPFPLVPFWLLLFFLTEKFGFSPIFH